MFARKVGEMAPETVHAHNLVLFVSSGRHGRHFLVNFEGATIKPIFSVPFRKDQLFSRNNRIEGGVT